jgi:RNA polymerase sigma-70 factor (ECF subfamily)
MQDRASLPASVASDPAETDAALIVRSAAGDRTAFDRLADRHLGRVYRLALRLTGDPAVAEEIAQEALVRAWRHAGRFDPARGQATTWLHRIVVNLATDWRRSAKPGLALPDDLPSPSPNPLSVLQADQRRTTLAAGIAALPERQRAAIVLSYIEQQAGSDAAQALGVSARALEGLLRRGRRFLRAWLQEREV